MTIGGRNEREHPVDPIPSKHFYFICILIIIKKANLWEAAVSLVQDLDNNIYLVNLSIVSQLPPHAAEDLGERPLAQTFVLKHKRFIVI